MIRAALFVAAAVLAMSWARATEPPARGAVDAQVEKARSEISWHRLVEARSTVRSVLRKAPGHPEANAMLCGLMVADADTHDRASGWKKRVRKEWNEAALRCGRAANVNAGDAREGSLQRLRLRALLRVGAWNDAAALFETLIASSPSDGRFVGGYAAILDRAGRGVESQAALRSAAARDPEFDRAARFEFIWNRFDLADGAQLRDMIASLKTEDTDPEHLAVLDVLETALSVRYDDTLLGFLDLVDRDILSRPELEKLWTTIASPREGIAEEDSSKPAFADIELPKIVHKIDPVYPKSAMRRNKTGHVVLLARINLDGSVSPVWIVEITNPEFAEASVAAVLARRYTPAKQHGEPFVIPFTVRVDFKLRGTW